MALQTTLDVLDRLIAEQEAAAVEWHPRSTAMLERAKHSLAGGVTSSWQSTQPQPIWMSHGQGSKVYDIDGYEYVDMHGGYGVSAVGHAHPAVVAAVSKRVASGTHFAQPSEDAVVVAENLVERFGLPLWRFANSGTEATMDAVHLMRAFTGRPLIVKVEGSYHGHHDSVLVSVYEEESDLGPYRRPHSVASNRGIPEEIIQLTRVIPFNDLASVEELFAEIGDQIAGVILEPIMMNIGVIPPVPGYLEGLRELTKRYGALLTFDEVKTGFTTHYGGVTRMLGVTPDIVCLAKALGGGVATAAIGGSAEVMGLIVEGGYDQVGTFNGNPLAMAAARATVTEILTEDAYPHFDNLRKLMVEGAEDVLARYEIPGYLSAIGAKGCVMFSEIPVRNYRDFLTIDNRWGQAHWLFQYAGGVLLPPWGKSEQWLVSVQHTEADAERFIENFAAFGVALRT